MKKLFVIGFCLFASPALAGPSISGGGKGVICRDQTGSILSAELLDIWEAKNIYGRTIAPSDRPVQEQVFTAIDRLKFAFFADGEDRGDTDLNVIYSLRSRAEGFLREKDPDIKRMRNVTLSLTDDSFETAKPSSCEIEQIVNYKMSISHEEIFLNQDLFEKLDATNQAALIVHEAVYSMARNFWREPNSLRTRRAVGYVFAGESFERLSDLLPKKRIACGSEPNLPLMYFSAADDKGSLRAVTARFGLPQIGYFASVAHVSPYLQLEDWTKIFTDQVCEGLPDNGEGTFRAGYPIVMGSAGPVDYDNNNLLLFFCKQGKLDIRMSPEGDYAANAADLAPVSCALQGND